MDQPEHDFSKHFVLKNVGRGVFATIHARGGAAIANAGIVDLGDATLVFDTFISPLAAKDLRVAAETLTGKPVSYVINSHYHNDHVRGNQEFPEAQIISTAETLALFKTAGMDELASDQNTAPQQYQKYLAEFEQSDNEIAREGITFWLDYYRVLAESLEGLHICFPQRTFEKKLILSGTSRKVELICFGGGHTGSDAFLFIPDEGVLFLSDLLFVGCHPFLADGYPEQWIDILEQVKSIHAEVLVPGHGTLGTSADLDLMINYIQMVGEAARTAKEGHPSALPVPFTSWEFDLFYPINLGFMSRLQSQNP